MISKGNTSVMLTDITSKISEGEILSHYLGVTEVPSVINSPLRKDNHPSFGIYSPNGVKISYKDFSTGEGGGLYDLLSKMWKIPFPKVLEKIYHDLPQMHIKPTIVKSSVKTNTKTSTDSDLKCRIREWQQYDIDYWKDYGITLPWLKYADVYPISHKIIIKNGQSLLFKADKYAYAYVEKKEGKVTLKIYQPFNKEGFKWSNKHDSSVISLWTKIPQQGDKLVICSSLKDALCIWINIGIPAIAPQGEGYKLSETAIKELKKRFNKIFILFDNDEAGIKDASLLSQDTGFINIVLPKINNCKDVSDLYKSMTDKQDFHKIINNLLI